MGETELDKENRKKLTNCVERIAEKGPLIVWFVIPVVLGTFYWGCAVFFWPWRNLTEDYSDEFVYPLPSSITPFLEYLTWWTTAMIVICFIRTVWAPIPRVPLHWAPEKDTEGQTKLHDPCKTDNRELTYCDICECFKPPRGHHCRRCNKCTLVMDHHCVFANNCVSNHVPGKGGNRKYFIQFLGYATFTMSLGFGFGMLRVYSLIVDVEPGKRCPEGSWECWSLGLYHLNVLMLLSYVGPKFFNQLACIFNNVTSIEFQYLEEMYFRRTRPAHPWPFTHGSIITNMQEVLGMDIIQWILPIEPKQPFPIDGINCRLSPDYMKWYNTHNVPGEHRTQACGKCPTQLQAEL